MLISSLVRSLEFLWLPYSRALNCSCCCPFKSARSMRKILVQVRYDIWSTDYVVEDASWRGWAVCFEKDCPRDRTRLSPRIARNDRLESGLLCCLSVLIEVDVLTAEPARPRNRNPWNDGRHGIPNAGKREAIDGSTQRSPSLCLHFFDINAWRRGRFSMSILEPLSTLPLPLFLVDSSSSFA